MSEMREMKTPVELLQQAARQKDIAGEKYDEALFFCVRSGISNTKMAQVLGVSETAVRNYVKRRGWR